MAAGLGFKTFTTGEVLTADNVNGYLMQGVLVFASAAARDAAITSPQEGQCCYLKDTDAVQTYSGSAWVGFDDSNAIQNSIVDAKGDIVAASGNDTPARLAVGNNGETLVADSSTSTGLRYTSNFAAGKNKIINGDFSINQRSFTSTTTDSTFGFDRWQIQLSGATGTYSSQAFTPGAAPVAGYEGTNFARFAVTVGNDNCRLQQKVEDVRTLAGQTATLSFWAKGTNPTTAGNLTASLVQNFGSGGSSPVTLSQTFVLTANWTRYSLTFSLGSMSGKTIGTSSALELKLEQATSISTDAWTLDIWGVQIEAGSVATAFQTATGTIQGELAACQRYYYRFTGNAAGYAIASMGNDASSTTAGQAHLKFPVTMRTIPSTLDTAGTWFYAQYSGSSTTLTALTWNLSTSVDVGAIAVTAASGLSTTVKYQFLSNNTTASYVGFSAEL